MLLPGSKFFDVRFSTCSIFEIPANPGLSVAGDFKHIVSPTHDWMKLAVLKENYNANHTLEDWRGFFCATGFVIPISTVHAIQVLMGQTLIARENPLHASGSQVPRGKRGYSEYDALVDASGLLPHGCRRPAFTAPLRAETPAQRVPELQDPG
jgi:hypothetical protein